MPLARARIAAPLLWAPSLILLIGCASRDVPTRYPESSAASLEAPTGRSATVTQALAGDPPLPGEESTWQGLEDSTPAANDADTPVDPHAHHRGHHAAH
jgi:hypothetical protein